MKKSATNTTIRNITKQAKLSAEHVIPKHIVSHPDTSSFLFSLLELDSSKEEILYNLGLHLLGQNSNPLVKEFLEEYEYPKLSFANVPNEFDLLGAAYQYLNTKYENLSLGSFYTSRELALDVTKDMTFSGDKTLIDPSCGSGVFLFAADIPAEKLFGVDFDPIAVMIAKFNFFLKFPDSTIRPQIYQADFLEWYAANSEKRFSYVVGNPPYGANLNLDKVNSEYITTGESFSYFVEYGFYLLETGGTLSYLLPEAFLNVKRHMDIRDFVLNNTSLTKIKCYDVKFSGVMSDIYQIELQAKSEGTLDFISDNVANKISQETFKELKNHIFALLTTEDSQIILKIRDKTNTSLKGSLFGLGVVTGDNKTLLLGESTDFTEPIFTGKEVEKYKFASCKNHLVFERKNLQQVAPDIVYRAPERLIYKVITKRLKVAIDLTKSLTTASANIIVPKVENNNVYSLALLLNSDLYSFLNQRLHGSTNKVSKENLEALPLPSFTDLELKEIEDMVKDFLQHNKNEKSLQEYVYSYFKITAKEREYIISNLA